METKSAEQVIKDLFAQMPLVRVVTEFQFKNNHTVFVDVEIDDPSDPFSPTRWVRIVPAFLRRIETESETRISGFAARRDSDGKLRLGEWQDHLVLANGLRFAPCDLDVPLPDGTFVEEA